MENFHISGANKRLGIQYFPDTNHYRESDLQTWLPELRSLGITWLTLQASSDRAIPESFIAGLLHAGIEPILHFPFNLSNPPDPNELSILLNAYAKWGVRFSIFFDRPNSRSSWPTSSWAQDDLVERFLDRFFPIADIASKAGLTPVFPPLEPGGNYWDTAFLNSALHSLRRRKKEALLDQLALSAYAWTNNRSLNWGAGGPERWPGAHPYCTPSEEEDQRGFRVFDWYATIARSNIYHPCPIILLGAGCSWDPQLTACQPVNPVNHAQTNLTLVRLINGEVVNDPVKPEVFLEQIPPEVIACNFWLLAASPDSPYLCQAWFQPDNNTLPIVGTLRQWSARNEDAKPQFGTPSITSTARVIDHYLLLPVSEGGFPNWHLELIRPFILKHHPTIGFSLKEASHALKVTVIGNQDDFSEDDLITIRNSGCIVDRITGDGTSIASQLAER